MGEKLNEYGILMGEPEGRRPLGRPRRRRVDNKKKNLTVIVRTGIDWIHLAMDRDKWKVLVNTEIKLRVP
jgi:hypothetical protein